MVLFGFAIWQILSAVFGAFGTAWIHEKQGRDVTHGGLMGLFVGSVGGMFVIMVFWIWLYYRDYERPADDYQPAKRWFNWWGG
jgi:hypothetical protein